MLSRFAIILIIYFVLYRLSNWFNLLQGYSRHSKQNPDLFNLTVSQFLMVQFLRVGGLLVSSSRQPGHFLSFLRWAKQTPQFIPQGATS
jgi:hypothetical protein